MDGIFLGLGEPARELALRGAVIGRRFPLGAVRGIWSGSHGSLDAAAELLAGSGAQLTASSSFAQDREIDLGPLHAAALEAVPAGVRREWLAVLEGWALGELSSRPPADEALGFLAPLLASALAERNEVREASFWLELTGLELKRRNLPEEASEALRRALEQAEGTRRLVLLRRLTEQEISAGRVRPALERLTAGYARPATLGPVPAPVRAALLALTTDPLDDWTRLGTEEASIALELVRGEALSQLGESVETRRAFEALQRRLGALRSDSSAALWARWIKVWAWFLGEILGQPREAERACAHVRAVVSPQALQTPTLKAALLRAEQISASRVGDSPRARALADEYLALTQQTGEVREELTAWNAKGILHLSMGELVPARTAFDRSRQLARELGIKRREAIALHNLGLTLGELGEFDAAVAAQQEYLVRSAEIANEPARAYGPASLAAVEIARGDPGSAEAHLAAARKVAQENAWPFILAWCRGLSGHLRLSHFLQSRDSLHLGLARSDYLACLDVLEEQAISWTEELDPGEFQVGHALTLAHSGKQREAVEALQRAAATLDPTFVTSHAWIRAGLALVERRPLQPELEWFLERGHARVVGFLRAAVVE
ncbi:MAG: tetratricopeptide repeat protein [Myxococcota bacterium]|nr:tetratricopeptide repeat protein [Myxococcota bacterium]